MAAADHGGKLVAVGAAEFGACAVEVALHGTHRHRKSFRDIAIGQACGDEIGDLTFAYGQRQRTARELQRGGAKPSAGGGKAVRGASCYASALALTGGLMGDAGLRGGVRSRQQGADLFELLCCGVYCVALRSVTAAACAASTVASRPPVAWATSTRRARHDRSP